MLPALGSQKGDNSGQLEEFETAAFCDRPCCIKQNLLHFTTAKQKVLLGLHGHLDSWLWPLRQLKEGVLAVMHWLACSWLHQLRSKLGASNAAVSDQWQQSLIGRVAHCTSIVGHLAST